MSDLRGLVAAEHRTTVSSNRNACLRRRGFLSLHSPLGPKLANYFARLQTESGKDLFIPTRDVFATAQACLLAQESAKKGGEFMEIPPFDL